MQWEGNYERSLGAVADATRSAATPSVSFWSYVDVYDLAHALRLAAESSLDGHEAMYVVAADNGAGRPLRGADRAPLRRGRSTVGELAREDAGGISSAKAERLIGYRPTRSWRDYLSPGRRAARRGARAARARPDRGPARASRAQS